MNLNLNNANRKTLSALKLCLTDAESLKGIDGLEYNYKETIEELSKRIESIINEFEWTTETVAEFLIELRDRKSEGEVVIDELVTVLCLENIQKEEN